MKKSYTSVFSLLGMCIVIVAAIGLDTWMDKLRQVAMANFSGTLTWFIPATVAELFFAGLVVTWLWFVYYKDRPDRLVALIITLAGLGLLFYNIVSIALAPVLLLPMLMTFNPKSLSMLACALVAVVGLQRLIFGKAE
jgi:hypothetical protein